MAKVTKKKTVFSLACLEVEVPLGQRGVRAAVAALPAVRHAELEHAP